MKPPKQDDPSDDVFLRLIADVDADMEDSGLRNWLRERYVAAGLHGEGDIDEKKFLHWVKGLAERFASQDVRKSKDKGRSSRTAKKSPRAVDSSSLTASRTDTAFAQ